MALLLPEATRQVPEAHRPSTRQTGRGRLIVVSHRGPGGDGGVAAALDPLLVAGGGAWVASDGVRRPYQVVRVPLGAAEREGYYRGYANSGLWPLCHSLIERAVFRPDHWRVYRAVNERFARTVADVAQPNDVVWVHDYQLALVPRLLRQLRPDLAIAFFWHIPWPARDIWRFCPQGAELVAGILGADLIGMHIPAYVQNFQAVAGATPTRAVPIGIDFERINRLASTAGTERRMARLTRALHLDGLLVGLGVDRLDYTKGVPQRLAALETFFDRWPEYRGRLTFVQVGAPTREGIEDYRRLRGQVQEAAARLNARLGRDGWQPVRLLGRRFGLRSLVALYRRADFALVTPLADGMNLVAKEFVGARVDERGVLILSETAGAADELSEALLVSPLEPDGIAAAIHTALNLPEHEQARRMARMRLRVARDNVYRWLETNLQLLQDLRHSRLAC